MNSDQSDSRLPRAKCPECYRDVALRRGSELREHRSDPNEPDLCPASGLTVEQAEREIADSIARFRGLARS